MSRGDRREEIFRDDLDRQSFLQALGAACEKTGWQVHAYCLTGNHFHLVVETPRANLVEGMVSKVRTDPISISQSPRFSLRPIAAKCGRLNSLGSIDVSDGGRKIGRHYLFLGQRE